MPAELPPDTVIVAAKDQVSCEVGGEAAILHLGQGRYYGLNPVGARIWKLLETPHSLQDIAAVIAGEYEVELPICLADIGQWAARMQQQGLVESTGA